jgi:hypothetical protein
MRGGWGARLEAGRELAEVVGMTMAASKRGALRAVAPQTASEAMSGERTVRAREAPRSLHSEICLRLW